MKDRTPFFTAVRSMPRSVRQVGPVEVACPRCGVSVELLSRVAGTFLYRLHYVPGTEDERCRMSGQPVTGRA